MKVRKLLEIQSKFEDRAVPCDMNEDDLEKHYSESKGEYIDIVDMDLIHLVRSYSKCLRRGNIVNQQVALTAQQKEDLREKLDTILMKTYNARDLLGK